MSSGVYTRTEEHRLKIGKGLKNRYFSPEHRRKISLSLTGKKISKETRDKLSNIHKGKHYSLKTEFKKGRNLSEETKKKMLGHIPWNKGMVNSLETRQKISDSLKGKRKGKTYQEIYGEKWRDEIEKRALSRIKTYDSKGRTIKREKHEGVEYKLWRLAVFERDGFTCQECGQRGGKLNADHIKRWSKYPELRYKLSNGRTLCINCHKKTDTYGNKK